MIYDLGKGGKVILTDPEGTELEFTLNEKYYDRALDDRGEASDLDPPWVTSSATPLHP
jgi:hypothetical protein